MTEDSVSKVYIGKELIALMEDRASRSEKEVCGLLLGHLSAAGMEIEGIAFTKNMAPIDPETRFEINPARQLLLQRAERIGGPPVVGVWHSHPKSGPEPSPNDLAGVTEDNQLWLNTGLLPSGKKATQAYLAPGPDAEFRSIRLIMDF